MWDFSKKKKDKRKRDRFDVEWDARVQAAGTAYRIVITTPELDKLTIQQSNHLQDEITNAVANALLEGKC